MEKLLKAYKENPCTKTALALRKYEQKHPMSVCMLTPVECAVLNASKELY